VLLALGACLVAGCGREFMPTPNLFAEGSDDPFANVPPAHRSETVRLLYATDRQEEPARYTDPQSDCRAVGRVESSGMQYSARRSTHIAVGTCTLRFGPDLTWEQLCEETRRRFRRRALDVRVERLEQVARTPALPRELYGKDLVKHHGGREVYDNGEKEAIRSLRELVQQRLAPCRKKEAYVYVHGFNSTLKGAAMVLAQLWHFLGRDGVPIIFSWPAGYAGVLGYFADTESGEASVPHLKWLLRQLSDCPGLSKVHVIAHSRGAHIVATALRELHIDYRAQGKTTGRVLKLGHVVLIAADIDAFVVQQRVLGEGLHHVPHRSTVYICPLDRALGLSELLHIFLRLGGITLEALNEAEIHRFRNLPKVDVVIALVRRQSFFWHEYFTDSPAVSSDLILLLRDNVAPGQGGRSGLVRYRRQPRPWEKAEAEENEMPPVWLLKEGYPFRCEKARPEGEPPPGTAPATGPPQSR